MTTTICTNKFVAAHGKAPRGTGMWAFIREAAHGMPEEVFFTPSMAFRDACAFVRARARAEGFQDVTIFVGS